MRRHAKKTSNRDIRGGGESVLQKMQETPILSEFLARAFWLHTPVHTPRKAVSPPLRASIFIGGLVLAPAYSSQNWKSFRALLCRTCLRSGRRRGTRPVPGMAGDCGGFGLAHAAGREAFASKGEHPERRARRVQYQGQRLPLDCLGTISRRRVGNPLFRQS